MSGNELVPVVEQTPATQRRMITVRLGSVDGAALLFDPETIAALFDQHIPRLLGGTGQLDPMQDAIRSAVKIPARLILKLIKQELQARGAPEELWPRKIQRGEDTLLYTAQYLLRLLLAGAEFREWVADYADLDSGDLQIRTLRPGRSRGPSFFDELAESGGLQSGADPVAVVAAGTGPGTHGPRDARADDPRAPGDDGRPSGADATPIDGAELAGATRQPGG